MTDLLEQMSALLNVSRVWVLRDKSGDYIKMTYKDDHWRRDGYVQLKDATIFSSQEAAQEAVDSRNSFYAGTHTAIHPIIERLES